MARACDQEVINHRVSSRVRVGGHTSSWRDLASLEVTSERPRAHSDLCGTAQFVRSGGVGVTDKGSAKW